VTVHLGLPPAHLVARELETGAVVIVTVPVDTAHLRDALDAERRDHEEQA
jgi:hypothetical protein